MMGEDTLVHVLLATGSGFVSAIFAAGTVYTWMRMSISRLEENANNSHKLLDEKINKNFETLAGHIRENETECKEDLSGIGGKVSRNEKDGARRYHNVAAALMLVAPIAKEKEVSQLLKEEAS